MNNRVCVLIILFFIASSPNAGTITLSAANTNVNVFDIFSVDIVGVGFFENVDGGGVNVAFNQNILRAVSVSIDEVVWDFGVTGISTGTIDNLLGTIDSIMVNAVADVTGDFVVATVEFQAVSEGFGTISLSEYGLNPWASNGIQINPQHVNGSVTVSAIPIPPAIWLFVSGILGLVGVARIKSS